MSRIGSTTNFHQPDRRRMTCKYWEQAVLLLFKKMATPGCCRLGNCKKRYSKETKWSN